MGRHGSPAVLMTGSWFAVSVCPLEWKDILHMASLNNVKCVRGERLGLDVAPAVHLIGLSENQGRRGLPPPDPAGSSQNLLGACEVCSNFVEISRCYFIHVPPGQWA